MIIYICVPAPGQLTMTIIILTMTMVNIIQVVYQVAKANLEMKALVLDKALVQEVDLDHQILEVILLQDKVLVLDLVKVAMVDRAQEQEVVQGLDLLQVMEEMAVQVPLAKVVDQVKVQEETMDRVLVAIMGQ